MPVRHFGGAAWWSKVCQSVFMLQFWCGCQHRELPCNHGVYLSTAQTFRAVRLSWPPLYTRKRWTTNLSFGFKFVWLIGSKLLVPQDFGTARHLFIYLFGFFNAFIKCKQTKLGVLLIFILNLLQLWICLPVYSYKPIRFLFWANNLWWCSPD